MNQIPETIAKYVDDILHAPEQAHLDMDTIPKEHVELAHKLVELGDWVQNLSQNLSMQIKAIAGGDYTMENACLGPFSDAFDDLVMRLKRREAELQKEKELFTGFAEYSTDYIILINLATGKVIYCNQAAREQWRLQTNPVKCQLDFQNYFLKNWNGAETWEYTDQSHPLHTRYLEVHSVLVPWNDLNTVVHFIKDVTYQRREQENLDSLAFHDELTGLYNRRYALRYLEKCFKAGTEFSIAFIDMDYLKHCNDNYGHAAGDNYIRRVVLSLQSIPHQKIVCRMGGDEFIFISSTLRGEHMANHMEMTRTELSEHPVAEGSSKKMTFSYGICDRSESDFEDYHEMLSIADDLMYQYKFEHRSK